MLLGELRIHQSINAQVTMATAIAAISSALCSCVDSAPAPQTPPADNNETQAGPSPRPSDRAEIVGLDIQPESLALNIGDATITQAFVVEAIYEDATRKDITSEVVFSVDDVSLGTMQGAKFLTAGQGGQTTLRARWLNLQAQAAIDLFYQKEIMIEAGATMPSNVARLFAEAPIDSARKAPQLVYPFDGTLLPPNMEQMEVHFLPGAPQHALFRLSLEGQDAKVEVFTRCKTLESGCKITFVSDLWKNTVLTTAGRGPVSLTIEGIDESGLSRSVGASTNIEISATAVEGALYYWTTSQSAIMRVDFGTQAPPTTYWASRSTADADCVGCHAVSPNGEYLAMTLGGGRRGRLAIVDIKNQSTILNPTNRVRAQFLSWSPDSTKLATIHGGDLTNAGGSKNDQLLRILDGSTGNTIQQIDVKADITHVDWSPSVDRIVFTKATRQSLAQFPIRGGISYIKADGATWDDEVIDIVPAADGMNRYSPTYAPTGEFLLYAESVCSDGETGSDCDGDSDNTSTIWAIDKDGSSPPIFLTNLNAPGPTDAGKAGEDVANTFPRWAPFVALRQRKGDEEVMWVTFSSRRRVGLQKRITSPSRDDYNQLLWMAAISPKKIKEGKDGSFAPFALPFQDMSTSNHLAQWTQKLVATDPSCIADGESCEGQTIGCCLGLVCSDHNTKQPVCQREF